MADLMGDPLAALGLSEGVIAIIAGFFIFVMVLSIAMYIYSALAMMAIAKKTKTPNGWLAWIPFANIYLITQMSKTPWWTFFGIFLPIIPFIGSLAFVALMTWWFWRIAEECKKPGWWGILIVFVPILNLVMLGMLAWGKK